MRSLKNIATITLMIFGAAQALAATTKWDIDPAHSAVKFKVKHLMISNVYGTFPDLKGSFTLDDKSPTNMTAEMTINTKSVNTENAQRDEHLKSADFFDVTNNPTITFKSTKVTKEGKNKFKMVGDFTMRGVTKPVTVAVDELTEPVKDMQGKMRRGFSATAKINRKDFGVSWNKTLDKGGVAVSENVDVNIELELAEAARGTASDGNAEKAETGTTPTEKTN
jgi:polyisoprenoid-binding protein YceI